MKMKMKFICVIAAVVVLISMPAGSEEAWEDLTSNLKDINLSAIAVNPQNPQVVYCGSSKAVYKSSNGGESWRQVLGIRGEATAVNFISLHPRDPRLIFAASENGLFKSSDGGANWRKLFGGMGELERDILCIALHPQNYEEIYIGTRGGLFWSVDGGDNWRKAKGVPGPPGNEVTFIAISPADYNLVYLATTGGVFKGSRKAGWQRVFVTGSELGEDLDDEDFDDEELFGSPELVTSIAFNPANPQNLYLGTHNGVFTSYDGGAFWSKLWEGGLTSSIIQFILVSSQDPHLLYAATSRGVFEFSHHLNQWRELYRGITSRDVRSLALDSRENTLWAVAKGGVFRIALTTSQELSNPSSANQMDAKGILNYFNNEPTISEIQEAAISYAEVIDPKRIRSLRRGARYKALVPDLDLDYDKTINHDRGRYWIGPRDWSVGLSWDLGDLIWDEQQRLIDSQTRLMVQLRDDILNEVTRLYFARRRLQIELLLSPPTDIKEQVEKELRLQELTADIDALTGGYLSRQLSKSGE